MRFSARVQANPLQLVNVPAAMDSSKLRIASEAPVGGGKSALMGVAVAGATFALASMFRADLVKSQVSTDNKGMLAAVAFGGSIALGGMFDHGRQLPENIAYNDRVQSDFIASVRSAQQQNIDRLASYRTTIHIEPAVP